MISRKRKALRGKALAPICSKAATYFGDLEISGELYDTCAGYATIQNGLRAECKRCKAYVWNARGNEAKPKGGKR